jgi:hypothetical protein
LETLQILPLPLEINDYHRAVVRLRQSALAVVRRNVLLTLPAPFVCTPLAPAASISWTPQVVYEGNQLALGRQIFDGVS